MSDSYVLNQDSKSYPLTAAPCRLSDIGKHAWNVLANDLPFPLAVIKRSALTHNLAWMQAYVKRKGVALAPHGKTTMSPQLFQMQLAAGAWGLTFATVYQASVGIAAGAKRIIIANQVVSDADLAGLVHLLRQSPEVKVWFLVDSLAQLALIPSVEHGAR
jgi:D-serine dehydratase